MSTVIGTIRDHNERAAAVWSSGGRHYDRISYGIADSIEHAVLRLDPRPAERVLDLATGTGWTSRLVARRGAAVTGADIAGELLEAAREKAISEGLAIEYEIADAEQLPFESGAFDAVISTCGVMFASGQEAAAAELARVCRPGGRIALTTWTPDSNVARMFQVMKAFMAAPPAGARSPFEWGRIDRIRELLGDSFDLHFESATSYYREPSAEAAWQTFSTGYGPTRTLATTLDAERREELRRNFMAFHEEFRTELGVTVPRDYVLTVGTRR